jgi:Zn/Cd-binding protein ZinT
MSVRQTPTRSCSYNSFSKTITKQRKKIPFLWLYDKKNCENVCMEQSNNSEEKMHQNLKCIYEDFLRATLTSYHIFKDIVTILNQVGQKKFSGPGMEIILSQALKNFHPRDRKLSD